MNYLNNNIIIIFYMRKYLSKNIKWKTNQNSNKHSGISTP